MKLIPAFWACVGLVLVRATAGGTDVIISPNPDGDLGPYAVISERNIFHLNPRPEEPLPEPAKIDLPEIKFSGFYRIGRVTKALFCCLPKDKLEEPIYYDLAEGEKQGILQLLKIHYDKGEVEVVNSGKIMTLSLKEDSLVSKEDNSRNDQGGRQKREMFRTYGHPLGNTRGFAGGSPNFPMAIPNRTHRFPAAP